MKFTLTAFTGENPRLDPRFLQENAALRAVNCRLESGALEPMREPVDVETLGADALTIYRHAGTWLSWATIVNAAPGPVASDRLYFTGFGVPKMRYSGTNYDLKVSDPPAALTAALTSGTPDPALAETYVYSYTWVTSLGEETEPAEFSNGVSADPSCTITLSGFVTCPVVGRLVTTQRIYRSQTSELGVTTMFFIAERADSASDFVDAIATNEIQEELPSQDYNPPDAALEGLVAMPGGMMAAFIGQTVYFCEPFLPHAWPVKYARFKTTRPIVGLAAFGESLAVLTEGEPYIITGTHPDNMVLTRIETDLPCSSARSIVDMGAFVAYASPEGLVTLDLGGARLLTRSIITKDDWRNWTPSDMRAGKSRGRYVVSVPAGAGRYCVLLDLTGEDGFVVRTAAQPIALFYEKDTTDLFILEGAREIREFDGAGGELSQMEWLSKRFHLPAPSNMGVIHVEADDGGPLEQRTLSVEIFGDEKLRYTYTWNPLHELKKLPGGYQARRWQFRITGTASVTSIRIAETADDLAGG